MKKRIIALVALVCILASSLLMQACAKNKSLDYMEDKLDKYVKISADDYNSFNVVNNIPNTIDRDLQNEIIRVLCENKITPDGAITNKKNITISAGDIANIYYRGYTLDENNNKQYFDGGCNFDSDSPTALEIGSGSFVSGFEYNLIGKNQKDFATMSKITDGFLKENDSFNLTYSVYYADGTAKTSQTAFINLSDPNLDKTWGEGFTEYFNTHLIRIGEEFATEVKDWITVKTTVTTEGAAEKDKYYDLKIDEAYRIDATEETPVMVIDAYFPYNYKEESLQNKNAKFEVFIKTVQDYETPELNDAFITETLKITADDLAEYAGETLVEKYKNSLRAELEKAYQESVNALIDDAFWDHVLEKAEFKKLPGGDVQSYYDDYIEEINAYYVNYQNNYGSSSQFSSIDQFAIQYMGLESGADWKARVREDAELSVKQKLIFHYIIREEGFIPPDAELDKIADRLYNEYLESYLEYYGIKQSDSDYASKLATAKEAIDAQFGRSYWEDNAIYEYGMEKIRGYAKVTNG